MDKVVPFAEKERQILRAFVPRCDVGEHNAASGRRRLLATFPSRYCFDCWREHQACSTSVPSDLIGEFRLPPVPAPAQFYEGSGNGPMHDLGCVLHVAIRPPLSLLEDGLRVHAYPADARTLASAFDSFRVHPPYDSLDKFL